MSGRWLGMSLAKTWQSHAATWPGRSVLAAWVSVPILVVLNVLLQFPATEVAGTVLFMGLIVLGLPWSILGVFFGIAALGSSGASTTFIISCMLCGAFHLNVMIVISRVGSSPAGEGADAGGPGTKLGATAPLSRARIENPGICPNCRLEIPLDSSSCPGCGALFGTGSAWKVESTSGNASRSAAREDQ